MKINIFFRWAGASAFVLSFTAFVLNDLAVFNTIANHYQLSISHADFVAVTEYVPAIFLAVAIICANCFVKRLGKDGVRNRWERQRDRILFNDYEDYLENKSRIAPHTNTHSQINKNEIPQKGQWGHS